MCLEVQRAACGSEGMCWVVWGCLESGDMEVEEWHIMALFKVQLGLMFSAGMECNAMLFCEAELQAMELL